MKPRHALAAGLLGAAALAFLLPRFDGAQPRGLRITRSDARETADRAARSLGIEVDKAWPTVTWEDSPLLERELAGTPEERRRLESDPVVGPRLAGFRVTYFRKGLEKFPEYGFVVVGIDGTVLGARRRARAEEAGAKPDAVALRGAADRFVSARTFPGAPGLLAFDVARPTVLAGRTDHLFRYRVAGKGLPENVGFLLGVYFTGDQLAGWELIEEYRDGRQFRYELGGGIAATLGRMVSIYALLFLLAGIFLKKYHAGEVGVRGGGFLFIAFVALSAFTSLLSAAADAYGTNFGGTDARSTAYAIVGFKLLFFDVPLAALVSMAWAVGESYARERWGERLASFDAVLRRDLVNASVGRALLAGLLASPAVAAAALLAPLLGLLSGKVHADLGLETRAALASAAGPAANVLWSVLTSAAVAVVGLLFCLSSFHRRRLTALGLVAAAAIGPLVGSCLAPIEPLGWQLALGIGAPLAGAALFLVSDLLTAATALFSASLLAGLLPLAIAAQGAPRAGVLAALLLPLAGAAGLAAAGLLSRREVVYTYEDLAPHVKRIVERERVKAEIDAANRIQAALLPPRDPRLPGAEVASHYRAATEIGGDYFDFLPLDGGRIGLAFGDVAGHGLTSGIVMAMAKAALLVQTRHDSTPRRVMETLNDIVMRTAPKRMTMTFFFGVLDPRGGELRFCSAGHLDPYILRSQDGSLEALSEWGFPLGVKRREPFRERVVCLEPGDRLVLYSDGLIEAVDDDGEPFGFTRFEETLRGARSRSADEIRAALLAAVRRFTRNRPPEDDQTLVVLSIDGAEAAAA